MHKWVRPDRSIQIFKHFNILEKTETSISSFSASMVAILSDQAFSSARWASTRSKGIFDSTPKTVCLLWTRRNAVFWERSARNSVSQRRFLLLAPIASEQLFTLKETKGSLSIFGKGRDWPRWRLSRSRGHIPGPLRRLFQTFSFDVTWCHYLCIESR